MSRELRVVTPEGLEFAYRLAGPAARLLAGLIDAAAVAAILGLFTTALFAFDAVWTGVGRSIAIVVAFAVPIVYGVLSEAFLRGQTIGKRVMGLRVVDERGLHLTLPQVVIRNLLRVVDALPLFYLVGGIAILVSRRAQRLGDLAASTIVVQHGATALPELDQLERPRFNSLAAHPHLVARMRQKVGEAEARLLLSALLRREELDPRARIALYAELVGHLRDMVPFPEATTDALSDEAYLRAAVDLLFRRSERSERRP